MLTGYTDDAIELSLAGAGVISREAWEQYFVDAMYAAKGERKIVKR